jgi:universal stress protein A
MKLLLALEISEHDEVLVAPANALAQAASAEVVLLNVLNPMTDAGHVVADSREEAVRQVLGERRAYLDEFARRFEPTAGIRLEQLKHGEDIPGGLARVAREEQADVLIIATNRASGVRGMLLGSVAQHLLRVSPCPVLVVRVD